MSSLKDLKAAMNKSDSQTVFPQFGSVDTTVRIKNENASSILQNQSVDTLLDFYISVASAYCRLSKNVITDNIRVVADGLPDDMRNVSLPSLVLIAQYFGKMTAAIIIDYQNCRHIFLDAIEKEIAMLKIQASKRKLIHEYFTAAALIKNTHTIELGVTAYTPDVRLEIAETMNEGISAINHTRLSLKIDSVLSVSDPISANVVGAILSNPVYILLAFNNDADFVNQILNICSDISVEYDLL